MTEDGSKTVDCRLCQLWDDRKETKGCIAWYPKASERKELTDYADPLDPECGGNDFKLKESVIDYGDFYIIPEVKGNRVRIQFTRGGKKSPLIYVGGISDDKVPSDAPSNIKAGLSALGVELKRGVPKNIIFEIKTELQNEEFREKCVVDKKKAEDQGSEDTVETKLQERAYELLKDPWLIQRIRHVLDFKVAGQSKKKLLLFLICLSSNLIETNRRENACVTANPNEGKSFLLEKVLDLFPEFKKIRMNAGTLVSVYRQSEKSKTYYDKKILYFGDLGTMTEEVEDLFSVFRQLVTEGKISRPVTVKVDDNFEVIDLVLEGYPVLVWTALTPPDDRQDSSRVLPVTPVVNNKQRELIKEFDYYENAIPRDLWYPKKITELEESIKKAIEILEVEALPIINPYTTVLENAIQVESSNINRDRAKIYGLVHTLTHLYQFQRERITIGNRKYIITDPVDVLNALYIAGEEFSTLLGSLDSNVKNAYEVIRKHATPISEALNELKIKLKDKDVWDYAQAELDKYFTNEDVETWLDVGDRTARRYTRELRRKNLIVVDKEKKPYKFYLPPESQNIAKLNGSSAFSGQAVLEGLRNENNFSEWLNTLRTHGFSEGMEENNFQNLDMIPTPDWRIENFSFIPPWDHKDRALFKQPQWFDYLLEDEGSAWPSMAEEEEISDESKEKPEKNDNNIPEHGHKEEQEGIEQKNFYEPEQEELIKNIKEAVEPAKEKYEAEQKPNGADKKQIKHNILSIILEKYPLIDQSKVLGYIEKMHNEGEVII